MSIETIKSVSMLDLDRQYAPIKQEILAAMASVFESKQFIMGDAIEVLETATAAYCGVKHAIGVSSGTDALVLALMALEIGPGDEVITTPFTFFATAGSIARVGATPVFVDIDPKTYNIDPALIESKITDKTKAIMPVHLFGQMADMDAIMAIAQKHGLKVIEDAAQAIGSEAPYQGQNRRAGSIGDIGCFSFFPSKNLGCCGDGGLVSTNDPVLAERMKVLRVHGSKPKYYHHFVGGNFRLDTLQAAVLNVKLPYLEDQHLMRQKNAAFYDEMLSGVVTVPYVVSGYRMIYNQYTLRLTNRQAVMDALQEAQIGHAIYYPVPLHLQPCFAYLGYRSGDCPVAEQAADQVLSIPIFSELLPAELEYCAMVIRKAVS